MLSIVFKFIGVENAKGESEYRPPYRLSKSYVKVDLANAAIVF
jgi:hypothetical protein|tara:strand:- start:818 stop:946 length:129 start_codon:yes stop_codon:yes gene_type:complete